MSISTADIKQLRKSTGAGILDCKKALQETDGNVDKAILHYQEALKLKSPYPEANNNLGNLYYQLGKIDDAIQYLQKAVREAPNAVDANYNLANCLASLEKLLEAEPHYKAVLKLRPDHLGALHNMVFYSPP